MTSNSTLQHEILFQLDKAAQNYKFPTFDNINYPAADMRLSVFRDNSEWLILFEKLVYSDNESAFLSMVHAFGNKIPDPGFQPNSSEQIISEAPHYPIWDNEMNFSLDLLDFTLKVKGTIMHFLPTRDDYRKAHVNLEDDSYPEFKILCFLVFLMPDALFRSDDDLLKACNRSNLPKFIQLDDWHHPDLFNGELPSHCDFFKNLAQSIEEGSYHAPNQVQSINSYWYHWEYFWC